MNPTAFPGVNPLPFQFPAAPFSIPSIAGMRSFAPQLPAVGGYSAADLERMMFALRQSGLDPGMLARIQQVQAMRRGEGPAPDLEAELLRPTPAKIGKVRQFGQNAAAAHQQLLDALSTQPAR